MPDPVGEGEGVGEGVGARELEADIDDVTTAATTPARRARAADSRRFEGVAALSPTSQFHVAVQSDAHEGVSRGTA